MADLSSSRLKLFRPPFWSTGVDCFGPLRIKLGRRVEKRLGILFKCMITRCTHIELLASLNSDSFLMSLRRFIAHGGCPYELLSDCGTNFKGGDRELRDAFTAMDSNLREQLSHHQIRFQFNPPNAPHFGGMWEREEDGGTAKYWMISCGPSSSSTTCLIYRCLVNGRRMLGIWQWELWY